MLDSTFNYLLGQCALTWGPTHHAVKKEGSLVSNKHANVGLILFVPNTNDLCVSSDNVKL